VPIVIQKFSDKTHPFVATLNHRHMAAVVDPGELAVRRKCCGEFSVARRHDLILPTMNAQHGLA
jgi:hypothetical protein